MSSVNAGRQPGRCTGEKDVKFGRAKTGTEQIGLLFEITDGEHKGKRFTWYGNLSSEESIEVVSGVLRSCGWDGVSWTKLGPLSTPVQLVFEESEPDDDGETYVTLRMVYGASVAMRDELNERERKALFARLDKKNGAPTQGPTART